MVLTTAIGLNQIIHKPTLARSASEGRTTAYPRLRFGLVFRTLHQKSSTVNNPG